MKTRTLVIQWVPGKIISNKQDTNIMMTHHFSRRLALKFNGINGIQKLFLDHKQDARRKRQKEMWMMIGHWRSRDRNLMVFWCWGARQPTSKSLFSIQAFWPVISMHLALNSEQVLVTCFDLDAYKKASLKQFSYKRFNSS